MNTQSYFAILFQYNAWANLRVLDAIERQQITHEKILTLLGHILVAQIVWLDRIMKFDPPALKLWGTYTTGELRAMCEDANRRWKDYIQEHESFDQILDYKNFKGDPFRNRIDRIMMHVANHGTYHRGQIAMLMRQNGLEPVGTDFITWDREITGQ